MENEQATPLDDWSGGVQRGSTRFLKNNNELWESENARYSKQVGGITKSDGYLQRGNDLTSTTSTSTSSSTTTTSTSSSSSTTT